MLCGVALHDELAELRAEVGPQVFDDPVAFRAAFDDFIPEGSASTGEVSLLVGAIATGALQRLKEQLALGANPEMSIAVQGDLLARDRGTTETSGARWALSVLAHAMGAVPVDQVLTRPKPSPDSVSTAGRPPSTTGLAGHRRPWAHPPDPVPRRDPGGQPGAPHRDAAASAAARADRARQAWPQPDGDRRVRRTRRRGRDRGRPAVPAAARRQRPGRHGGRQLERQQRHDEEVLVEIEMSEAGKTVRLQLVADGEDASVVLLSEVDGEYVEVDREATSCPYLDTAYDAGLEDQGNSQIAFGWQNEDTEGYGAYGEVQIDEDLLILYEPGEEEVCPT